MSAPSKPRRTGSFHRFGASAARGPAQAMPGAGLRCRSGEGRQTLSESELEVPRAVQRVPFRTPADPARVDRANMDEFRVGACARARTMPACTARTRSGSAFAYGYLVYVVHLGELPDERCDEYAPIEAGYDYHYEDLRSSPARRLTAHGQADHHSHLLEYDSVQGKATSTTRLKSPTCSTQARDFSVSAPVGQHLQRRGLRCGRTLPGEPPRPHPHTLGITTVSFSGQFVCRRERRHHRSRQPPPTCTRSGHRSLESACYRCRHAAPRGRPPAASISPARLRRARRGPAPRQRRQKTSSPCFPVKRPRPIPSTSSRFSRRAELQGFRRREARQRANDQIFARLTPYPQQAAGGQTPRAIRPRRVGRRIAGDRAILQRAASIANSMRT